MTDSPSRVPAYRFLESYPETVSLQASRAASERKKDRTPKRDEGSEGGNEMGYQCKMFRCLLIHEIAYHFTRGLEVTEPLEDANK